MRQHVALVPLFTDELRLCNVSDGELVAILSEPGTRPEYVDAVAAAAAVLGASVVNLTVPGLGYRAHPSRSRNITRGNSQALPALLESSPIRPAVYAALMEADFIVDLLLETIALVTLREELQAAKKRILTITEPADLLERMFPTIELRDEVVAMRERFTEASEVRQTSRAGTDVCYDVRGVKAVGQYGFADVPGKWDNWPSGLVNIWPVDGTAQGRAVLQRGDIIYPFKRYVEDPVEFTVKDGYITSVEGGFDAQLISEYLKSWEDPEVYALAHVSIGMHPRAQWSSLPFYDKREQQGMDGRSVRGATLFTTGPNRFVGRAVEPHFDIACFGWSVYLDDQPVVLDGRVIVPESLAGMASASGA